MREWKQAPGHGQNMSVQRARRWEMDEKALVKAVAQGRADARQMNEYHWRVWHPSRPGAWLNFWPSTGAIRDQDGQELRSDEHGTGAWMKHGWSGLCEVLGIADEEGTVDGNNQGYEAQAGGA
jgi:hypothetical protein